MLDRLSGVDELLGVSRGPSQIGLFIVSVYFADFDVSMAFSIDSHERF